MGCTDFFRGLSKTYLVLVNVLTMLIGLVVSAASVYLLVRYSDLSTEYLYTKQGACVGIVAGLLTMCFSLLGCMAAKKQNKCGLFVYIVGMTLMMVFLLAAGVVGLTFLGYANPKDITDSTSVADLNTKIQREILSYELELFNKCGCQTQAQVCSDDNTNGYCIDSSVSGGFDIDASSVCLGLSKFTYGSDDTPLVNTNGEDWAKDKAYFCAGTTEATKADGAKNWVTAIHDVMKTNIRPLSIVFIALTGVQLLCIVFSCCLLCMNRAEYDPEYKKKLEEQRRAGDMTGTAQPNYGAQGTNYV